MSLRATLCCATPAAGHRVVASGTPSVRMKIRQARVGQDTHGVAVIFQQAFASQPQGSGSSAMALAEGFLSPPRTLEDWEEQVATALQAKQQAALESRAYRLYRQGLFLKAELARRAGQRVPPVLPLRPSERQQVAAWRRRRSFVVLVAEDCDSGELLGSATVSLAQPEAALPPPFPTNKPRRVYVSNIAVLPQHRRKGVASALLRQSERQASLWRRDSLWLHCELSNSAAMQLYKSMGYQEVSRDPVFAPVRRCLMRKDVPTCSNAGSSSGSSFEAGSASIDNWNGTAGGGAGNNISSSDASSAQAGVYDWTQGP